MTTPNEKGLLNILFIATIYASGIWTWNSVHHKQETELDEHMAYDFKYICDV